MGHLFTLLRPFRPGPLLYSPVYAARVSTAHDAQGNSYPATMAMESVRVVLNVPPSHQSQRCLGLTEDLQAIHFEVSPALSSQTLFPEPRDFDNGVGQPNSMVHGKTWTSSGPYIGQALATVELHDSIGTSHENIPAAHDIRITAPRARRPSSSEFNPSLFFLSSRRLKRQRKGIKSSDVQADSHPSARTASRFGNLLNGKWQIELQNFPKSSKENEIHLDLNAEMLSLKSLLC